MWRKCGHRFKKLEYKNTPIHKDLMALVAKNGEAYLKEGKDVFKAVLDMDQNLVDLDSSESYVTTECDDSDVSTEYDTNPENNNSDSTTLLKSLSVVADGEEIPLSTPNDRVNRLVTWNDAAKPFHRNHDYAEQPSPSGRRFDTPRPKGVKAKADLRDLDYSVRDRRLIDD
ncbi:hypothetical protein SLS56_012134 [Neofusicoccum ribis]|uniref:Uncharacterized protein n=1 Tax=Neofusicoccum ribis TaxID=45134 RepID=A0ABR3SAA9_9PEZI